MADTTYYINDATTGSGWGAGNDGTAEASVDKANPWATISQALNNHTSDTPGTDTITIIVRDGATLPADQMKFDSATKHQNYEFDIHSELGGTWSFAYNNAFDTDYGAIHFLDVTLGSVTIDGIIITGIANSRKYVTYEASKGMNLTISNGNCTTTATGIKGVDMKSGVGGARNVTLNDTDLSFLGDPIVFNDGQVLTVNGGSIQDTESQMISVGGAITGADIQNCNLQAKPGTAGSGIITDNTTPITSMDYLIFRNNKVGVSGNVSAGGNGVRARYFIDNVIVTGNTIDVNVTTGNKAGLGIWVGEDAATNPNPIGPPIVDNNTVRYNGVVTQHGIIIGSGADKGSCTNNFVDTGRIVSSLGIGIVVKCEGSVFTGNVVKSQRPYLLKGAAENKINHNTFYAYALVDDKGSNNGLGWTTDTDVPLNNIIESNIIYTEAGVDVCVYDDDGTDPRATMDYNCYFGADDLFWLDSDLKANITEVTDTWLTYSIVGKLNDQNSLSVDPGFKDVAGGDFTPTNPDVLTGGKPDINGNKTPMGASALTATAGGYRSRYSG